MNKSDLIDSVANQTSMSKAAASEALDAVLEGITGTLKTGDKVSLTGFGTFEVRHRQARMGRNPQTGAPVHVAARNVPAFKPGKAFKEAVN